MRQAESTRKLLLREPTNASKTIEKQAVFRSLKNSLFSVRNSCSATAANSQFAHADGCGAVSSLAMPLTQFSARPSNTAPAPSMPGTRRSRRPMPRSAWHDDVAGSHLSQPSTSGHDGTMMPMVGSRHRRDGDGGSILGREISQGRTVGTVGMGQLIFCPSTHPPPRSMTLPTIMPIGSRGADLYTPPIAYVPV